MLLGILRCHSVMFRMWHRHPTHRDPSHRHGRGRDRATTQRHDFSLDINGFRMLRPWITEQKRNWNVHFYTNSEKQIPWARTECQEIRYTRTVDETTCAGQVIDCARTHVRFGDEFGICTANAILEYFLKYTGKWCPDFFLHLLGITQWSSASISLYC